MQITKKNEAFTLIEVLLVISIISILTSIVLGHVASARDRANQAKTIASLGSVRTVASYCLDDSENLNIPDIASAVCAGQNNWPAPVGDGWTYSDAGTCAFDGDVSDGTFMYCATNGTKIIACTETGCTIN